MVTLDVKAYVHHVKSRHKLHQYKLYIYAPITPANIMLDSILWIYWEMQSKRKKKNRKKILPTVQFEPSTINFNGILKNGNAKQTKKIEKNIADSAVRTLNHHIRSPKR